MEINFTKAEAGGNDFVILDNRNTLLKNPMDFSRLAKVLCQRRLSIGADGVLVLGASEKSDLRMRIFNPDGTEAEMCGNGSRLTALYAFVNKWAGKKMSIETKAGVLGAEVNDNLVRINMTDPKYIKLDFDVSVGNDVLKLHYINTGVPHAVHFTDDIDTYPVKEVGEKIRRHKDFAPDGTNVNFVKVLSGNRIMLRTFERGVEDETSSCGTGAVASAVISHLVKKTKIPVEALTKNGDSLNVYFNSDRGKIKEVFLEGRARIVFTGVIDYV